MKRPILVKIFGGYLLGIISVAFLVLIFAFQATRKFYLEIRARSLENLGNTLKAQVIPFLDQGRWAELDGFVKEFRGAVSARITVVDREGRVLADSDEKPETMEGHRFRPEIFSAFEGKVGRSRRYSRTRKEDMLYVGIPIKKGDEVGYVLRLSLYVRDVKQVLSQLKANVLLNVLVVIFISLLGSFLFARSLSHPIRELGKASRRIAEGDFEAKVYLKKRDELQDLAGSFNFMAGRIKNLFSELTAQKEELDTIVSSIEEGLLVLDQTGKVTFSNSSFRRIIQSDSLQGKYYWEILRNQHFQDLIKRAQSGKKNLSEEVFLNGRYFLCSANFLPSNEEVVAVLSDLTKIKNLEKLKKEFIANASHELRTPLAAIKGYLETLEESVEEKGKPHLAVVKRNAERLINIVNDMLYLSELEQKEAGLEREEVNLSDLVTNVLKIFEPMAKKKNLRLEFSPARGLPPLKADPYKLEQMLVNLLDNALKYTEQGKVSLTLKKEDSLLALEVQDTGVGISQEHLPRIFERFYVVDKSRSRRLGGTGLGLAIVKHIALLHGGEVRVESTPGEGSKFTILLPL